MISSVLPPCVSGVQCPCQILNLTFLGDMECMKVFHKRKKPYRALVSRHNHRGNVSGRVCKDSKGVSLWHFVSNVNLTVWFGWNIIWSWKYAEPSLNSQPLKNCLYQTCDIYPSIHPPRLHPYRGCGGLELIQATLGERQQGTPRTGCIPALGCSDWPRHLSGEKMRRRCYRRCDVTMTEIHLWPGLHMVKFFFNVLLDGEHIKLVVSWFLGYKV